MRFFILTNGIKENKQIHLTTGKEQPDKNATIITFKSSRQYIMLNGMNREDAETLSKKVVKILAAKRAERKITKLKISEQTGISRTAITLMEKQQNSPTLRTLFMIASCIGVDLKEIIKEAEDANDDGFQA